jgi:hypothetical protein
MMFDVVPRWMSRRTMSPGGWQKTKNYRIPRMPWGINADEVGRLRSFHPNIVEARQIDQGRGNGFLFRYAIPAIKRLPAIGSKLPSYVMLRFG